MSVSTSWSLPTTVSGTGCYILLVSEPWFSWF
ncbi:hypothetical protein F383_00773 [Gossypium arboreum]|uniref:Reelin domain-containing protein n=1 Tax=Gossypium arboreum TaxID=29729 RepID=A0A0B0NMS6_GOSAR|nr:hypothetical protein F383_00773 [Gossypium arboreum]